jgi:hypothetical protein
VATAGVVVGLLALAAVCLIIARAVAREQRSRRDEPLDRTARRARRHADRAEHADIVRTMLFGRWGTHRPRGGRDDTDGQSR